MSESEQDKQPDTPEPVISHDAGFSHLMVTAIQANELFNHLRLGGFSKKEALHLTGVVLSSRDIFREGFYEFEDDLGPDEENQGLDEDGGDFI